MGVPGGGVGVGLRWVVGGGFSLDNEGKGKGMRCQNYPLANYPNC